MAVNDGRMRFPRRFQGSPPGAAPLPFAQDLARRGFRKYHERILLSGHAQLVLALFALIGALASLEAAGRGSAGERLMDILFVLVSTGIGLWALRRYLSQLSRAQFLAHQAECPGCATYARFQVEPGGHPPGAARLRCRACGHAWIMQAAGDPGDR